MPLNIPLGGSWLNMAESMQRILVRRALFGQNQKSPEQIVEWLERGSHPFVLYGKQHERRQRARLWRLAGSGAAVLAYTS
jgi:hypothetical protein